MVLIIVATIISWGGERILSSAKDAIDRANVAGILFYSCSWLIQGQT